MWNHKILLGSEKTWLSLRFWGCNRTKSSFDQSYPVLPSLIFTRSGLWHHLRAELPSIGAISYIWKRQFPDCHTHSDRTVNMVLGPSGHVYPGPNVGSHWLAPQDRYPMWHCGNSQHLDLKGWNWLTRVLPVFWLQVNAATWTLWPLASCKVWIYLRLDKSIRKECNYTSFDEGKEYKWLEWLEWLIYK